MSPDDTPDPVPSDSYADPEKLEVQRDEAGELLGVDQPTTTLGMVRVKPMPYGAIQDKFGDMGQMAEVGPEVIAGVIRDNLVRPELPSDNSEYDEVDEAYISDEIKPLVPRDIIMAILEASGVDADVMVDQSGTAQVDLAEQGNGR